MKAKYGKQLALFELGDFGVGTGGARTDQAEPRDKGTQRRRPVALRRLQEDAPQDGLW